MLLLIAFVVVAIVLLVEIDHRRNQQLHEEILRNLHRWV